MGANFCTDADQLYTDILVCPYLPWGSSDMKVQGTYGILPDGGVWIAQKCSYLTPEGPPFWADGWVFLALVPQRKLWWHISWSHDKVIVEMNTSGLQQYPTGWYILLLSSLLPYLTPLVTHSFFLGSHPKYTTCMENFQILTPKYGNVVSVRDGFLAVGGEIWIMIEMLLLGFWNMSSCPWSVPNQKDTVFSIDSLFLL